MLNLKNFLRTLLNKGSATLPVDASLTSPSPTLLSLEESHTLVLDAVKAITRMNADTELTLKERIKSLIYIDNQTHLAQQQLCQAYLSTENSNKNYLPAILNYWQSLANAYQMGLRLYKNAPQPALEAAIHLINLRGLHHQLRLITWNALRYLKPEDSLWQQSFRFYLQAEEQGIARNSLPLYPHQRMLVSCELLLIQAGMLFLSQTDNLPPQEILATDQLLMYLCQDINLGKQPALVEPVYVYDLAQAAPPQTMQRGILGKSQRYWSSHQLSSRLADLMFDLESALPPVLAQLTPPLAAQDWLALCEKLAKRWSTAGGKSLRKAERSLQNSVAQVTLGFINIGQALNHTTEPTETYSQDWKITDSSDSGMGLNYLGKNLDQLTIDRLVLVQAPQHRSLLARIRRIVRHQGGTLVGLQLLGHTPLAVQLYDPTQPQATANTAIYLTASNACQNQRYFLIPKALAPHASELVLSTQGKAYQIRLKAPQQALEDCVNSQFDTLAKIQ